MPGDRQRGNAVIASPAGSAPAQPFDVAPTLLALLGFPASNEMPGSVAGAAEPPRIATYGNRNASTRSTKVDQDYYDNLKSLGYIR
jgi:arylsulfatase A-like enzyme